MQKYKHTFLTCILLMMVSGATAQQSFSVYHMESLPQRTTLNPALLPDCKWFIGLPGFNSMGVQAANTGFSLNEITRAIEISNGDTLLNLNKVLNVLSKKNYMSIKADQTWLNFGFRLNKHFISANVTDKAGFKLGYPKDLFRFIIDGNGGANLGQTFDFRFSADAYHYREYGLNYAYQITDRLTLGTRIKYLQGISRVELADASVKLYTRPSDYALEVSSNVELNVASSLGELITRDSSSPKLNVNGLYRGIKNTGWGIDFGAEYALSNKLKLSASIIDLGYINWKQNASSMRSSNPGAKYLYDGFPISSLDSSVDANAFLERLADSITGLFALDTVRRSFRSALSTEFLLGASYEIANNLNVNALFYGDVYNRRLYGGLTLGLYWRPLKVFSININNTFYGNAWLNPGVSMSFNAGPAQFYFASENFLAPISPGIARGAALRMGINVAIGRVK